MQFDEYLWLIKQEGQLTDVEQVTVSDEAWISWGGLKWCPEERFQQQLNREGCQETDSDNPNARQYKEMTFYKDASATRKVNKAISNYKKGIYEFKGFQVQKVCDHCNEVEEDCYCDAEEDER
ncbi:spore protein H [Bacillus wiedmannii]|uniref:spore protein H n=1 Tax=Bacillus wiedmannii TaxID=1890302 RepID=UPI003CEDC615